MREEMSEIVTEELTETVTQMNVRPKSRKHLMVWLIPVAIVVVIAAAIAVTPLLRFVLTPLFDNPSAASDEPSSDQGTYVQLTEVPSPSANLYSSAFAAPDPIWDDVIAAPMSPVLRIYGDAKTQWQVVPVGGRTENKPFPGVCTVAKGGVLRLYGNRPDNGTNYTAIEYLGRSSSAPAVSGECAAGTLFPWDESTMTDSFS